MHYLTEAVDKIPDYDPRSGDHYWIIGTLYHIVNPAQLIAEDEAHLDQENLVYIGPSACFYCEEPHTLLLAKRRCPGRPRT